VLGWFFSSPAAIFYAMTGEHVSGPLEARGLLAPIAGWLFNLLLAAAVARWVLGEARRAGWDVSYDFPTFCFFSWPVFAPVFAFRTRGWRGFAVLGWFVLIVVGSAIAASLLMTLLQRG
jgi:hypothetical protein